jgi:F-type H+-transporting ATPase subunit b
VSPILLGLAAATPHMDWLKLGFALLNFVVLLFLLRKLLFRPLGVMAATRHDQIKKDLDEAGQLRATAQARLTELDRRIAGIDDEVAEMVAVVRRDADAERARILAAAEEQSKHIAAEAERTLATEIARVEREVRQEAARAAIAVAEKILRERITADDDRHMVERFAKELEGRQ